MFFNNQKHASVTSPHELLSNSYQDVKQIEKEIVKELEILQTAHTYFVILELYFQSY